MTDRIYQDDSGKWHFPYGVCQTVTEARDFDGSDVSVPCGGTATKVGHYAYYVPYDADTHKEDIWVETSEAFCDEHFGQFISFADANPKEMRIVSVTDISHIPDILPSQDSVDNMHNKVDVDWNAWYRNIESKWGEPDTTNK